MYDTLRANIHPTSGRHLSIISDSHLGGDMPILLVIEHSHHHGVRDNHPWGIRLRMKQSQRMPGFDHQGLLLGQLLQILLNQTILHPILTDLPSLSIRNQLIRIQSDIKAKVIIDHYLKGLSLDTFTFIFRDRLRFQVSLRTVTITIDPSPGQ